MTKPMQKPLRAYAVLEKGENTGGIIFARSDIDARKRGSCEWSDGDITSVECRRAQWADEYAATGRVEAKAAIAHGWRFECSGCGLTIDEYLLSEEGMAVEGVIGMMDELVFCCAGCKERHDATEARKKAYGAAFLEELRTVVRQRFGDVTFADEDRWRPHVYVYEQEGAMCIRDSAIHFHFPGEQIAPASLIYRHDYGRHERGPQPLHYSCCNGDRQAFEAFAASTKKRKAVS